MTAQEERQSIEQKFRADIEALHAEMQERERQLHEQFRIDMDAVHEKIRKEMEGCND